MTRLSGLQKEVLALYRSSLREIRKKPASARPHFHAFARAEFEKNLAIDKRDFAAVEYLLRGSSRDAAASPRTVSSRPSPAVTARLPKSLLQTSPVGPSTGKRPHRQRNVIRKRRRSGVRVSFNRSSSSAASLAGGPRSRAVKARTPGKGEKHGKHGSNSGRPPSGGQGRSGHGLAWGSVNRKAKGFQTWFGHILSPKDGATSNSHQRIRPADISHPIPLLLPSDGDGSTPRKPVVPSQSQGGRYSLMQVPEEQTDVARWTAASELRAGSGVNAPERGAINPALFSTEYAHVGPLDHGYDGHDGHDGHASSQENARIPAQKHSVIARKPVGASHCDKRLTKGQDRQHAARTPQRKSREHVSVVPTLTCRHEKRFGLADPKVWSTVSRTLSQQQRLSDIVTPEQSERSSCLDEVPQRSPSRQKKIDRFTRELQRYQSVHPKPPESTPPEPPSRDSLRTVSALVPYHGEFKEAGLAVTSAEQMRLLSARRPDSRVTNPGVAPVNLSSSSRHVGKDAVRGPGTGLLPGRSADKSLCRPCSIQRTPPGGIVVPAADPVPVTPKRPSTSPRKVLPWLCEKQTEPLPVPDTKATSGGPVDGPQTPAARVAAARVSIREPEKVRSMRLPSGTFIDPRRLPPGRRNLYDTDGDPHGSYTTCRAPPIPFKSASRAANPGQPVQATRTARDQVRPERRVTSNSRPKGKAPMVAYMETETCNSPPARDRTEFHDRGTRTYHGEWETEKGQPPQTESQRQDARRSSSGRVSRISAAIRPQPTTIPEETEMPDADTTVDVNKPLPKTPGEAGPSVAGAPRDHGEVRAPHTAAGSSEKQEKPLPQHSASPRTDHHRSRGAPSPSELPNAWKYAIVTDSSLEKALDGVISKLRELDDANCLVCEREKEKKQDTRKICDSKKPLLSRTSRTGDGVSLQIPPPPPPKENVYNAAGKGPATGSRQERRPRDEEEGVSEWEDQADEVQPPPPPPRKQKDKEQTPAIDPHDRDISDRDVLKGLRLALTAACDEDYDAWIRGKTGLRLRRFMADLKGFEDIEREAAALAAAARADQPARRRRAEQRRQEAARRSRRMSNG